MTGASACSQGGWHTGSDAGPVPDLSVIHGGPDLATVPASGDAGMPVDLSLAAIPIPGGMLGTPLPVTLACQTEERGWTRDVAGKCVRTMGTNMYMLTKSIQIDAAGSDGYRITGGQSEVFASDYQLTVTSAVPMAVWTNRYDPTYGTLKTHSYALGLRILSISVETLHNNDSPTPIPQCWEYSYLRVTCSGKLTW